MVSALINPRLVYRFASTLTIVLVLGVTVTPGADAVDPAQAMTAYQTTVERLDAQREQALAHVGAIFETPAFYDYLSGWRNLEILSHFTAPTPPARIREIGHVP